MGYQGNAGHFSLGTGWEQILKFVLHTNKFPGPGQLNCLAFQKLKLGNGNREGTWKPRNRGENIQPQGAQGFTDIVPCLFIRGFWFLISVGLKEQNLCLGKGHKLNGLSFPVLPFHPLSDLFGNAVSGRNPREWSRKRDSEWSSEGRALEPAPPETAASPPALSWEGAQLTRGVFPEGRGKPSGFSTCPPDPLGRTQNAY